MFSSIALDYAHEQSNATIKSDGGASGLTQNLEALQRWMVAGPELVRITVEFEVSMERLHQRSSNTNHHDQTKSNQVTIAQHVKSLVEVIEEMGNPFLEDSKDLLVLNTRYIADTAVASSVCCAEETGKNQYQTYINERLHQRSILISDLIKRNKLPFVQSTSSQRKIKGKPPSVVFEKRCVLILPALHSMPIKRWRFR